MGEFVSHELLLVVLNMSLTGGAVILFVLLARLALRRAPKIFSYALWAVVLFRLLCPVSLSADFSLMGLLDAPARDSSGAATAIAYIPSGLVHAEHPQVDLPLPGVSQAVNQALPQGAEQAAADPLEAPVTIATTVWLAGAAALALYALFSLLRLRWALVGATRLRDNIYLADHIPSPFVLGLLRPKIYLPSALPEEKYPYILLHEQHHIRRLDHLTRLLAFAALCIHWFNPLVWLAFVLSGRDMEMSCDEAVLRRLGGEVRTDYSASLLELAAGRKLFPGAPLAFGQGDTRGRIQNLLRWKRPGLWSLLLAGAVCMAVAAACAANPQAAPAPPDGPGQPDSSSPGYVAPGSITGQYASMEDYVQTFLDKTERAAYFAASGGTGTANVTGTRVEGLERTGSLEGLAPEGTLESWWFNYRVQIDVPPEEVMLPGGQDVVDGWFDLEGQGGYNIVALRYPDGSYDVLMQQPVNDGGSFYGYHNSYEEVLYDWYVTENNLDLPLYVEDWGGRFPELDDTGSGTFPVHRFDGLGWYVYIPVSGWDYVPEWNEWFSQYPQEAHFQVQLNNDRTEDIQGYWGSIGAWRYETEMDPPFHYYYNTTPAGDAHTGLFFVPETEKSSYSLECSWDKTDVREGMPELLHAMAASFTVDKRVRLEEAGELLRDALKQAAPDQFDRVTWEVPGEPVKNVELWKEDAAALLPGLADKVQPTARPEDLPVRSGTLYLFLRQHGAGHIALTRGEAENTVLIRYVDGGVYGDTAGVNTAATVDSPELYRLLDRL